jgi:hypothetical protein
MRARLVSSAALVISLAACSGSSPTSAGSPSVQPSKTAATQPSTLVLAASGAPGQTAEVSASTGEISVDQWWLKGRADLLAKWNEFGYQSGFKRTFRVPPAVEQAGIAKLPGGVLSAVSYAAIFKDAASAQAAVELMGSSIKADFVANGNAPQTLDASAFGSGAYGWNTYVAKFGDYNAQYGWADGNAARAIVVVGTNAAAAVALQLAQSLRA